MGKLGIVLAIGCALAACAPGDTWSSRVVEEPYMPPPPEHLLRRPADFRIYDAHVRKEFFLYMYEDESISEQVVTVINYSVPDSSRSQRLATRDEADYAMGLFIADWRSRGKDERLQYFNRRFEEEQYRKSTQYDDQIEHKKEEKKWWDTQLFNLESDLQSRQNTGAFAGGDEKFNLADTASTQKQRDHARRMAVLAEVQLAILEYKRAIRDSQYARAGAVFVESSLPVGDLLPNYSAPERLIDDIRQHVQPFAWSLSEVRIGIAGGQLTVNHTRDVVLMVRDYVDELRAQFAAKAREKALVETPKK
jgi:hypothetical protein